jgi:GNAT superfamily N-acetyltransferase
VDRSEERARERGAERLHQVAFGPDEAAHRLLAGHGYREVRRFYEMAVQLEAPPEVPDMGIERLDPDDIREFHDALDEAFADHWEHHPQQFEEWWERHRSNPNLDLSIWFLIREGGEMAAVIRNEPNRNGGGYVGAIGVRRPWRGKGYAKALLLHTFAEFYDRGIKRVTLGVDAQSPTGATHLYERVGMHVEQEQVVFEKSFT